MEIAHFSIAGRKGDLIFTSEGQSLRLVIMFYHLRDATGRRLTEDDYISYDDVVIKIIDRKGKPVATTPVGGMKIFTPILAGIGSQNGEYSLPKTDSTQLKSAQLTFGGQTVTIPLTHLTKP